MVSTHGITRVGGLIHKRYRSCARGERQTEWDTLVAAHRHTVDRVPEPVATAPDPPSLTMTRLPGEPLNGALTPAQFDGLEEAIEDLWAVPTETLGPRRYAPLEAWVEIREGFATADRPNGVAGRAFDAAVKFLDREPVPCDAERTVLGHADPNLANYLWDGSRVRIVDFEDAGVSDPTYELATLVEHIAARDTDWTGFLERFEVDPERLADARTLWASMWLLILLPGGPAADRNPPGTLEHQANRVLTQLAERHPSRPNHLGQDA